MEKESSPSRRRAELGGGDDDETSTAASSASSPRAAAPPSFPPLRFRAAGKGECAASECSLLCNDLLRRGAEGLELEAAEEEAERREEERDRDETSPFSSRSSLSSLLLQRAAPARMLVDPGVRVAYTLADTAHLRSRERVRGIAKSTWSQVSKAPAIDWGDNNQISSSTSSYFSAVSSAPSLADPAWEACCLKPGADAVVWSEDCGWDSWRGPSAAAGKVKGESFLGFDAARRRREAGFVVDESVTVVGRRDGSEGEEEEEALVPPRP